MNIHIRIEKAAEYCSSVASGELKPGLIAFTNAFDIDDGRTE